jgi:hypothetical protein
MPPRAPHPPDGHPVDNIMGAPLATGGTGAFVRLDPALRVPSGM